MTNKKRRGPSRAARVRGGKSSASQQARRDNGQFAGKTAYHKLIDSATYY